LDQFRAVYGSLTLTTGAVSSQAAATVVHIDEVRDGVATSLAEIVG
jgi:hypothetical protein